ncbi:hypothetical protein [Paenibacillus sp. OAS669]|uniref:hypothetical protein n=1 Tax=Paenibacillus sp. OAS669 TaxID=2663821 RepID=UPI001789EF2F|nr:hypothetical protein [Paenibacillus sp. OAS669]MBE1446071.1 hypothetical protein [Paenibacillus sp. OAS669]
MDTKLTQKDWLDYLNRLQDRERQKITSSGLSNWTLFAALAGLGYWILPEIPKIQQSIFLTLFGYVFFTNLTISLFDIFNQYYRKEKILKYRFPVTEIDIKGTKPLYWTELLMLGAALVANVIIMFYFIQKGNFLVTLYFVFYILRYLNNLLGMLASGIVVWSGRTKEYYELSLTASKSRVAKINLVILNPFLHLTIKIAFFVYVAMSFTFQYEKLKLVLDGLAIVLSSIALSVFADNLYETHEDRLVRKSGERNHSG